MRRVLAFVVLWPLSLAAQIAVSGRILDPSNTPVAGVAVVLRQGAQELTTFTSETGGFRFDKVLPGQYELLTAVPGFDPVRREFARDKAAAFRTGHPAQACC